MIKWLSKPHESPGICRAKEMPSFLTYFKILSIGPPWESNPWSSLCSQVLSQLS